MQQRPIFFRITRNRTSEDLAEKFTQNLPAAGLAASMEARERYSWKSAFSRLFNIYTEVVNHYSP